MGIIAGLFLYFAEDTLPVSDTAAIFGVVAGIIVIVALIRLNTKPVSYQVEIQEHKLLISKNQEEYNISFSELILTDYHYHSKIPLVNSFNISILTNQQESLFLFFESSDTITEILREFVKVELVPLASHERKYSSNMLLLENGDTIAYGSKDGDDFSNFKLSIRRSGKKENKITTSDLVIPPLKYQES